MTRTAHLSLALAVAACGGGMATEIDDTTVDETVDASLAADATLDATREAALDVAREAAPPPLPGLRHSDIVLMPEWEPDNFQTYVPLHPTVVAWGVDPVGDADPDITAARIGLYHDLGVRLVATNVWMLTATAAVLSQDAALRGATVVDIAGDPIITSVGDGRLPGHAVVLGLHEQPRVQAGARGQARARASSRRAWPPWISGSRTPATA